MEAAVQFPQLYYSGKFMLVAERLRSGDREDLSLPK